MRIGSKTVRNTDESIKDEELLFDEEIPKLQKDNERFLKEISKNMNRLRFLKNHILYWSNNSSDDKGSDTIDCKCLYFKYSREKLFGRVVFSKRDLKFYNQITNGPVFKFPIGYDSIDEAVRAFEVYLRDEHYELYQIVY